MLGFPSDGIHANGFSLVRRIVGDEAFDADLLLPPTRLYLDDVRALRTRADVRGLAHVTGGGIAGNLARVLPVGLGAVVDPSAWERPAVFAWLADHGVPEDELRRVFNIGIGYCAVVPAEDVGPATSPSVVSSRARGCRVGRVVGVLVAGRGSNLQALLDDGMPVAAVASHSRRTGTRPRDDRGDPRRRVPARRIR